MVVVNLVYGLTLPLLSIVLDAQGVSKTMIGLSIVAQASAGVLLAPLMPRLITRSGAARVMQQSTLLAAGTLIALGLFQDVYAWFAMRFLLGAAGSMLWSASEAVINELVDDDWRGRIIGIYCLCSGYPASRPHMPVTTTLACAGYSGSSLTSCFSTSRMPLPSRRLSRSSPCSEFTSVWERYVASPC
jgi:MFS family permease